MKSDDGAWWRLDNDVPAGVDYGFSLDDAEPLPDPRSPWQPDGVHGPSRRVDHSVFGWRHGSWRAREFLGSVVYELHVGTFTAEGTFDAAITRLDHLVDLGIDFVEVMPVAAFPGRHGWGYDGVFPYAVQESYGGPEGLKRFVDACHGRGLGVLLDVVYNHLGPDGNVLSAYGPYFTDKFVTPWGSAINFCEAGSDEARRYFIDNALAWLRDYRLDGLRLDAVHAIFDTSATHLLEELACDVARLSVQLGRPLVVVAESDLNDPRFIGPRDAGGYAIDAQWSDDFHHALHAVLTGETFGYYSDFGSLRDLATAFRRGFVYAGEHSRFRDRRHGRPLPSSTNPARLLAYAQNHDQIGNRAKGERLGALTTPAMLKVAAALVLTSPFTPMMFMGEEWAASTPWQYFTDHEDPELAESVRSGRRREFSAFGWKPEEVPDPQDPLTQRNSVLRWEELDESPHQEMLRWHRELIALRHKHLGGFATRFGEIAVEADERARVLRVRQGALDVVANLSAQPRVVSTSASSPLLASGDVTISGGHATVSGESVAILAAGRAPAHGELLVD